MLMSYYKRALQDLLDHRYLNAVTIITIALSILIASAFVLFFVNANDIIGSWKKGIRMMVYLKPSVPETILSDLKKQLQDMQPVQTSRFIPKEEALSNLRNQMRRQASVFENLRENPLPDAFEIRMIPSYQNVEKIETFAEKIESNPAVAEVEYGQRWLGQFSNVINLFRLAGYALVGLFCLAALFIVANTSRLILYSRQDEIEVMRLVGATDGFIKAPFYIQGLIQGALGGVVGMIALFIVYSLISSNVGQELTTGMLKIHFFSPQLSIGIVLSSMLVGWIGCFLSLEQFLRS